MSFQQLLLKEAYKRFVKPVSQRDKFLKPLFSQQRAFIDDPSKLKAALCSRRAGKTTCAVSYLLLTATDQPGTSSVYIGLTRKSAKRIIWNELKKACREYGIGATFNNTELMVTLDNESVIYIVGASDEDDMETLRGQKYALVIVDECASFKSHFGPMVNEVIEPALIDLDGTLALLGTPSAACVGVFFDATTNAQSGYSVHKWSILDNPFIPGAKAWLYNRMKQKGWGEEHPAYQREWLGRWIKSNDSLVYKFIRDRNTVTELPNDLNYILGIDLGYDDATAFVVVGYSEDSPDVFVDYAYSKSGLVVTDIENITKRLVATYDGFTRIVVDTGGLGKTICEELRKRTGIAFHSAEKTKKADFIEVCNGDFYSGKIKIRDSLTNIMEEMELLQWDESDTKKKRMEDPRFNNHLCDAFLYAYREARHYLHVPKEIKPKIGSSEYYNTLEKEIQDSVLASFNEEKSRNWWEQ